MNGMTSRGEGRGVTSQYAAALLYNGLGHYDKALAAAELACEYDDVGVQCNQRFRCDPPCYLRRSCYRCEEAGPS